MTCSQLDLCPFPNDESTISLTFSNRPLPGLAPVLVDVIFEAIERIREEGDTVLLMEQHALAAFEIADYGYVSEFGKLNMLGDAPKLLDESFGTAAQPGRPFGESDRL
jgi:ABC-type branched-subunit amino acid transport system ATPase component